jgi:hypothetical protein
MFCTIVIAMNILFITVISDVVAVFAVMWMPYT